MSDCKDTSKAIGVTSGGFKIQQLKLSKSLRFAKLSELIYFK